MFLDRYVLGAYSDPVKIPMINPNNFRLYGEPPFSVVVVHGGPGAGGEMAPVAQVLEAEFGVLEPLQTELTLEGQVNELRRVLEQQADLPVQLVGFSWGAWLSYILTARHPEMVKKLILVGSGPYIHQYAERIQEIRLARLSVEEKIEYNKIIALLNEPDAARKGEKFSKLGQLAAKTDRYDPIEIAKPTAAKPGRNQGNDFHEVLKEAQEMRADGRLLALANQIQCPVAALHGDYDPHPAEGVFEPLSTRIKSFRFHKIENCGHKPWIERQAKEKFFEVLQSELSGAQS